MKQLPVRVPDGVERWQVLLPCLVTVADCPGATVADCPLMVNVTGTPPEWRARTVKVRAWFSIVRFTHTGWRSSSAAAAVEEPVK